MNRLEEIKARISAASPGPWRALMGFRRYDPRFTNGVSVPMVLANNEHALGEFAASMGDGDRALIVNAREDLEHLVAEVERLGDEVHRLYGENARLMRVPAPHPDPASLERENTRLNEKLQAFTQTAWGAQAQVDSLLKEVKDLRDENDRLARENARLTQVAWEAQKRHPSEESLQALRDQIKTREAACEKLEAENQELRVAFAERATDYERRLERYEDLADGVADQLEKLGFRVFAPGHDVCDND